MLPRLYDASTDKNSYSSGNGYGFLRDIESCLVTEERNGEYSLAMTIYQTDRLAKKVAIGMIIKALANTKDTPQLFYITSISITTDGKITILANHIKYLAMQNYTTGYVGIITYNGTPKEVMDEILSNLLIESYLFYFSSDITSKQTFTLGFSTVEKLGDIYGGKEGSLLYVYGGEYHFDNFKITLMKQRGSATDKVVRFGKNISNFKQVITNDNVYTHIVGIAYVTNKSPSQGTADKIAFSTEPKQVLKRTFNNVCIVDFSSDINDTVDSSTGYHYSDVQQKLNDLLSSYISAKSKAEENISISVTYEPELDKLQDISLCDTVKVYYPPLEINYTSKVVKVVFDSIKEKYTQIDISDENISLINFTNKRRK